MMQPIALAQPQTPLWQLNVNKLILNQTQQTGIAHHSWLSLYGTPLFYSPFLSFPLTHQRKSGFLMPLIAMKPTGLDVRFPFYLNLATNYDATITPRWLSQRGVQFMGTFRYLTPYAKGQFISSVLLHDRLFSRFKKEAISYYSQSDFLANLLDASPHRKSIAWQQTLQLTETVTSHIDYNWVSDPYLLSDLDGNDLPKVTSNSRQLVQQMDLNWKTTHTNFLFLLQHYQTLALVNNRPVNYPYNRLPELTFTATLPFGAIKTDWFIDYTYFTLNKQQPTALNKPVYGERIHFMPKVTWQIKNPLMILESQLEWPTTFYQLNDQWPNRASSITRTLPIFQLKAFKEKQLGSWVWKPRIHYSYIPYRSQRSIPVFDSTLPIMQYDRLFQANRFTGIDRIGDTSQIAVGLTASTLGKQPNTLSVGHLIYFDPHHVGLCTDYPGCENAFAKEPQSTKSITHSVIAAQWQYHPAMAWSIKGNYAWDPQRHQSDNADFHIDYRHSDLQRVHAEYRYSRDTLLQNAVTTETKNFSQAKIAFTWPFVIQPNAQWQLLGAWQRNMTRHYPEDFLLGVEYNGCCSAFRLIAKRHFTALNPANAAQFRNSVYLQWEFKGLGTLGTTGFRSVLDAFGF